MDTENTQNIPPEQPIPTDDSATEIPSLEISADKITAYNLENTNPMEIHTHGHVHETNKWKEYVFQFIMLFLAITLSFFVENQREHYIEHQRAKILAASIVQNLQDDIKETRSVIKYSDSLIFFNKTLIAELNKPRASQNDSIIHLYGLRGMMRFNVFDPNLGNYEQVKHSGALRYFDPEIVNELTAYETNKNYVLKMAKVYLDFIGQDLTPFCIQNTNPRFIDAYINKKNFDQPVFTKQPTPEFLDQIYSYALYINTLNKMQIRINKKHAQRAEKLIALLTENYHLDKIPAETSSKKTD